MSFLLTGLPRIRSAWFSALLDCQHDSIRAYGEIRIMDLCDPSVACLQPRMARYFSPVVVIDRPENESRAAFEQAWGGVTDEFWSGVVANYRQMLCETDVFMVNYHDLSDSVVSDVCAYLGRPQPMERIERFQMLKIEEYQPAAVGG